MRTATEIIDAIRRMSGDELESLIKQLPRLTGELRPDMQLASSHDVEMFNDFSARLLKSSVPS